MDVHKKQTDLQKTILSSLTSKPEDEFIREYKKYNETSRKELYLQILTELEYTISKGNIQNLKIISDIVDYISNVENQATLKDYYDNTDNPIKSTNLIILACKQNKVEILKYLFGNIKILNKLSIDIGKNTILPNNKDETCHNAFYYAIRSSNVDLLNTLINEWPGNYFATNLEDLDEILSAAYDELKLKNVPLSEKIEIFVENKLINLRFFSNDSEQVQTIKDPLSNVKERIGLVLEGISLLNTSVDKIDEKFLFTAKFVAQNIHILKRQLKSTYDELPWEEIEFCLIIFVSSHIKQQEINLFYHGVLNKSKILSHLRNFAQKLDEKNIEGMGQLARLPKLTREKVVASITNNYPQFEELYNDYQQIRDIYSLKKISYYINLALSADPKKKEGHLIITRALQVVGECLKNTLESPKLSSTTSELLLLSLPKNTREIIIDLRNSLSHAHSLSKRMEIEENADVNFLSNIQNDIKKISSIITDIFYNNKIKMIRILLKKLINSESLAEIKEVAKAFKNAKLDETISGDCTTMELQKLEKLIKELNKSVTEKTSYEEELFKKINDIINFEKIKLEKIGHYYIVGFASLKHLIIGLSDNKIDHNDIRGKKIIANKTLENIGPQIESHSLKDIAELSRKIYDSITSRIHDLDEINRLICKIFLIAEFGISNIKWIEVLKEILNKKGTFIRTHKQIKTYTVTEENYKSQLTVKLSQLKIILSNNGLSGQLIEKSSSCKSSKKLQAAVEMLVLDIMSILGISKNCLENNLLFLDGSTPLLTGRCLRNHLAHDNAINDTLLSDPSMAIVLNAKTLSDEEKMRDKKKIGKLVVENLSELKDKYGQGLVTITNQERMFVALEEGNLKDLQSCLKNGADINARSISSWTTLHFAAKGPSLEIMKFILDQNLDINAKDVNGQNPLHIAAAYGRICNVKFLIEAGLCVNNVDSSGKTSLHIATQNNQKDTVEVLLRNKASTIIKDRRGLSPLHYAIRNNHIDVAKNLLQKDANVDINESNGGFTPLHEAAEKGNLELVNFLLQNKANVNAKTDRNWTPLHAASLHGHLEIVNALILKGADVNAGVIHGCTPLHYAAEYGQEKIADILLKHGANVNTADQIYKNAPLHYAAKDGHEETVKTLLNNKASANVATVESMTPLHFAAKSGHLGTVIALLKHGVNINSQNKNHFTPLHIAVASGHTEVADLLIKSKAEINAKANGNSTPLHVAALKGYKDITNLLINNKARVIAEDDMGRTPLHIAAMNGSKEVIDLLIRNKAEVNARDNDGITPLFTAALTRNKEAVIFLIRNKAEVNTRNNCGSTALHAAIEGGQKNFSVLIKNKAQINDRGITDCTSSLTAVEVCHKEIIENLIANGANINAKSNDLTPLCFAIKHSDKQIVELLIANGADVNQDSGKPLSLAVLAGYKDIVKILLKHKANVNIKYTENVTALHVAAQGGHKQIVNALLTEGADVDAITTDNMTPLNIAAEEGYEDVVEILIARGANVNNKSNEGVTPLHMSATRGHGNVVRVLLDKEADVDVKDNKNRTPLESAVAYGHLQVVKLLLQYKKVDMNAKGNNDWTILHTAARGSNLEMIKYLINEGSDINAKTASGLKPIHIAAIEGCKDIVEFFISMGFNTNDTSSINQTLLHHAAMKGQLEVVKYLIAHGAHVNAKDDNGQSPMHIAAKFGYTDVIKVLLENGAVYNAADKHYRGPLEMVNDKDVINLLASTAKLFEAVKCNSPSEVENCIKAGAFVNAKDADNGTPLHYAAWKGYDRVVNVLLQNKSDPNAVGKKGFTPLHYAAKFSHFEVVKTLLSNGAIYNAVSDSGKMPLDFTVDESVRTLFKLVSESFKNVRNGEAKVINDLNKIKDTGTIKAIMSAHERENKNLIVAAIHNSFPNIEQLKEILQDGVSTKVNKALSLIDQGKYETALGILRSVFEKRKEILGADNLGTLDIQVYIAHALYKQGAYQEASNMLKDIFQKQKEMLGLNAKDTLSTRSFLALILHRQGKNEEAFNIYEEVYQRQKEMLGPNHPCTLDTLVHMALVLDSQGKYEEALDINRTVFKQITKVSGANDPNALCAQNNIAMVLTNQGKYEEALKLYKEVLEKKKVILGSNHSDTLRTFQSIATILSKQEKYREALKAYEEVLDMQKNVLGPYHPDTLHTQYIIGNVYFVQGKYLRALKTYREGFDQRKVILGQSHPSVLNISNMIEMINKKFKLESIEVSELLQHRQKHFNIAASNGDMQTVQRLLKDGADVNDKDINGRTPLHYAVSNGNVGVVNILLKNGAVVTQVTNKGNTPLHTAVSQNQKEIVGALLQHVSHDKLNYFMDAKTTLGGTTSLHVAAKNGFLEIVKLMLKHGATYNVENKEGKTPFDLSKDQNVSILLKLLEELFEDAKNGNVEIISKLRAVKPDVFIAVTNTRNIQGSTLLQVAIMNKHEKVARKLLDMLKETR